MTEDDDTIQPRNDDDTDAANLNDTSADNAEADDNIEAEADEQLDTGDSADDSTDNAGESAIRNIDDITAATIIEGDALTHQLRGMYRCWFLEYASYVILERAVPHIQDGLKPVQRRILHSMKTLDDGRFNKVANIVGNTMQYHPHGDASIKDALVQLGQKELLVETQGNWGNILTGASAAAGRYIEARLSPFALETLYDDKVTDWTMSYDGRKKEPITLPTKFPLLLAQGAEGIAVGLSSRIMPHNFNEIIDAAIAYLRGEDFELYPDFPTGGMIDVSKYNDGRRGGRLRIRAKIEKVDNKTIAITEIPYGKTTGTVIDSILSAFEKGKIKIRKVEDHTAQEARILVYLQPGTSSDKTIDALYAFSFCEVSISPNCCVIENRHPQFLGVSDVLRYSVDHTREILLRELQIELGEVNEALFFASLEKYFIEKRIYKDKEYEQAPDLDSAVAHIDKRLEPLKAKLIREVTRDDIIKLLEIKMRRILRFNADEADRRIANYLDRIQHINDRIEHLTQYTIEWFERLKEKYGHAYPRRTQLRNFDTIEVATVAEANERLYINRKEGFIGTALKNDEFVCNCSSLDDIIIFYKDGRYKVVRVSDKISVGNNILHLAVFKRKDERTIYNVIYQDGRAGAYYMKRFAVTGVKRDTEYNLTKGTEGSRVVWFSANTNGEAEVVKVTLKPRPRLKTLQFDVDFSKLAIKGRASGGNLVTRNEVHRFSLKEKGTSTLGGRQVWFDPDVLRLNYEGRGQYLGEFQGTDHILVILKNGEYYTGDFNITNHYEDNILRIEKFNSHKVWTVILDDADQGYPYIKRFNFELSVRRQRFVGTDEKSHIIAISDRLGARFRVTFGAPDEFRDPLEVDAAEFIGVKSYKARGKRLTTWTIASIDELEPREMPEEAYEDETPETPENDADDPEIEPERSDEEIRDEINGQQRMF